MSNTFAKERDFQRAAMEYLDTVLLPPCFAFHVPNEGKRSQWAGAELKRQGLKKGAPDIIIALPEGRWAGLELKSEKGRPTVAQLGFQSMMGSAGAPCSVVYSIDAITEFLRMISAPTRERAA